MLDIFKRIGARLSGKKTALPRKAVIVANYDSARTTRHNSKHWAQAKSVSPDAAADKETRKELRNRCRYEVNNNSYARGILLTLANDTIGTGPRLQVLSDNSELASAIEGDFQKWCMETGFFSKLRLARFAKCQDGEIFLKIANNPGAKNPVTLDVQLVEADRVQSEDESLENIDGVMLDGYGNAIKYEVLQAHPEDAETKAEMIDSEFMVHYFRPERPGQHRGVPEIVPALDLFAQLRRYTLAVITAAETAADFSAIMYTDGPGVEVASNEEPFGSIELDRNMMMSLPDGWKMAQLRAEQPTTTYPDFKHEILNEIARCLNMPYNVSAANSSGYNYASGQMDWQVYYKSIRVEQSIIEATILDKIFKMWFDEYAALNGIRGSEDVEIGHVWFWDAMNHVDPEKEATAQGLRLANMTTNFSIECAKTGRDWEEVFEQRAREIEKARELGLSFGETPQEQERNQEDENNGE